MRKRIKNKLQFEKSPYLLQHAENPVKWLPWGEEAFKKAKEEDKPIFLSIGYSTCHWCHIMAHESFENKRVALLMNKVFISIKVDREERPDIDSVYMKSCQRMTGSGGWPLTIIMTPEKRPFFVGTYIPRENKFGRIGLLELIPRIDEMWKTNRKEVEKVSGEAFSMLKETHTKGKAGELEDLNAIIDRCYQELHRNFDTENGGFGHSVKFSTPHNLTFLLRYWKIKGNENALAMVEQTLERMRSGGIFDQIGYGFHRYSTDAKWHLPHFEKMLYDQALLIIVYAEAYLAGGKKDYGKTVDEIIEFVQSDMLSPEGGFYSAIDADSEGKEGWYYLWEKSEIERILKEDADMFMLAFNVEKEGNFLDPLTGEKTGKNVLYVRDSINELSKKLKTDEAALKEKLESSRKNLFAARKNRKPPSIDDKILTDWNGLMIAALSIAARSLGKEDYGVLATNAADFILKQMVSNEGKVLHRYREGEAAIDGFLEDYSFLIWGLIELYEVTFQAKYLSWALSIQEMLTKQFYDEKNGGFFSTSSDSKELLVRDKNIYDGAIPSGNSIESMNLLRLGRISGNYELEGMAKHTIESFSENISHLPSGHTQFISSILYLLVPSYEVVIVGNPQEKDTIDMLTMMNGIFLPNVTILFKNSKDESIIGEIAPFTKGYICIDDKPTAYICSNHRCQLPITDKGLVIISLRRREAESLRYI